METKPWHGPKWPDEVPFEVEGYERPLYSILEDSARDYGDKTYTIFAGAEQTFSQVKETADRVAAFLVSRGLVPGDRAAVFLPNLPHYPPVFFGILQAGAAAVTCNPLYKASELQFQLKDSGARALFVMDHPNFYATAREAIQGTEVETVVVCSPKPYLPALKGFLGSLLGKIPKAAHREPEHLLFEEAIGSVRPEPPDLALNPTEDLAMIIYTGGTTGVPKGASLTHANLGANLAAIDEWNRIAVQPGEKPQKVEKGGAHCFLGVLPWYHSYGLTLTMLASCANGGRLVCIPDPRAGKPPFTEVLKAIAKYRVTVVHAVPTIYSAIVNHPLTDKFDLSSIVACGSGGAPLPVELARQFEARTGAVIYEGYGLSETSPVTHTNPTNTEDRKFGSIGLPLPGTDCKVVDLESGTRELPQGEDGEIAVSGPQVMKGYWNRPEENEAVFREIEGRRFFLTGDIGHMDEEGFFVITDRKKDLILVGGFNVYPREVEETLYCHPKVALAAVIGVPDEHSGERVKAFIQLKPGVEATEEEFFAFAKEHMAGYKRPREVEFREALPVTPVGKVLRRALREEELKKGQG